MSASKGGPRGAETEGSERCPAPPYQAPPGGGPRVTALWGPMGHIPLQGTGLSSLSAWEERSLLGTLSETDGKELLSFSQGNRGTSGPPSPPTGLYLGGDVGD